MSGTFLVLCERGKGREMEDRDGKRDEERGTGLQSNLRAIRFKWIKIRTSLSILRHLSFTILHVKIERQSNMWSAGLDGEGGMMNDGREEETLIVGLRLT